MCKLDNFMFRLGMFGLLFALPNFCIIFIQAYQFVFDQLWYYGSLCECKYTWTMSQIKFDQLRFEINFKQEYWLLMMKEFMHLIIGTLSCLWIWSWKNWSLFKLKFKNQFTKKLIWEKSSNQQKYLKNCLNKTFLLLNNTTNTTNSSSSRTGLLNGSNPIESQDLNLGFINQSLSNPCGLNFKNYSNFDKCKNSLNTYEVIEPNENQSFVTLSNGTRTCIPNCSSQLIDSNYSMGHYSNQSNQHVYHQPRLYSNFYNCANQYVQLDPYKLVNANKNSLR